MANEGGGDPERLAQLVGDLLIELGRKVQEAGPDGVRILTESTLQEQQLSWYRAGWSEHARAADPERRSPMGHPDGEDSLPPPEGRLLRFPPQPQEDIGSHPLPIVGASEAGGESELMPHRRRTARPERRRRGED
ncbi:hypothetical protein [Streptomyces beijiangensis]|uniref:Uncharacterized protein n=1 Tax=Streptomyces beijiangensis TaxID=163361 RepID=A0A939F6R9_9ACTN|nr:hypothetical protein [Streptomyces beijiangensis]MBO0513370.1 hypothetical protein [Streptomyces beijiangensis]